MSKKYLCCECLKKFNVEDLNDMPDGGSGGWCVDCEKKQFYKNHAF